MLFTGRSFSRMAIIGILILIGVVVNNGIMRIDHVNPLRTNGRVRNESVLQASHDGLRPLPMTVGPDHTGTDPLRIGP